MRLKLAISITPQITMKRQEQLKLKPQVILLLTALPKQRLNQLGGVDGKTEVVTIDGKTYNASKAAGHDFKAQPDLAEAAAKTTEKPAAEN